MSETASAIPQFETACAVLKTLRDAGFESYFAGGCVRDILLGRAQGRDVRRDCPDYDIATAATPDAVQTLFAHTVPVGAHFGVMLVVENGWHIQVAAFRDDGRYIDGRHPETVTFSTARRDAERRDFTINGMFWDPFSDAVHDWVGGRDDLRAGVIRAIGDPVKRLDEDKLRLMRGVRFACRFGFRVEDATLAAIRAAAPRIGQVSAERIREELEKILVHPSRSRALAMLMDTGMLKVILPEVAAMMGVEQPPEYHPEGDVWVHTLLVLDKLGDAPGVELAFAALLHDVGKPPTFVRGPDRIRFDGHCEVSVRMTEDICRRLRFSNEQTRHIQALVGQHMRFMDVPKMRAATLQRFLRQPGFEEHLALHRADCLGSHAKLETWEFCRERHAALAADDAVRAAIPKPLLSGDDLMRLGYAPGPEFKTMLAALVDAQLEGAVASREAAEAWLRGRFPVSG